MSMLEAFKKLNLNDKERLAMEATLKGIDLKEAFSTMDQVLAAIAPLYKKNMEALGLGAPATFGFQAPADPLDDHEQRTRCSECGIIAPRLLSGGLCDNCSDDRNEDRDTGGNA